MRKIIFSFLFLLFGLNQAQVLAQETQENPSILLTGARNDLNACAMSPAKYKRMAVAGWDNEILIYQTDSPFLLVQKLLGHQAPVNTIAYNFAGNMFASGSSDQTVRLYDSLFRFVPLNETGNNKHETAVHRVLFDRAGKYLFSGDKDGKLIIWDLMGKKSVRHYLTGNSISDICLSPTPANLFIAHSDPQIKIFALATGNLVRTLDGHTDVVNCLAMSPNNKYLISGSNDKSARIWDLKTMKTLFVLKTECWKVVSVAFTEDSKYCVTGCNDGSVRVWETETGKLISKWNDNEIGIQGICFTKNNQYVLVAPRIKGNQNFGARMILSGLESTIKTNTLNFKNETNPARRQLDSIASVRPLTKQDSIKYKAILLPPKQGNKGKNNGGKLDSAIIYKTPMNGIPVKK